jgi:hypothetical protein
MRAFAEAYCGVARVDGAHVAAVAGEVQRRHVGAVGLIGARARLDELEHAAQHPARGREVQWRVAIVVLRCGVCTGTQQLVHGLARGCAR